MEYIEVFYQNRKNLLKKKKDISEDILFPINVDDLPRDCFDLCLLKNVEFDDSYEINEDNTLDQVSVIWAAHRDEDYVKLASKKRGFIKFEFNIDKFNEKIYLFSV